MVVFGEDYVPTYMESVLSGPDISMTLLTSRRHWARQIVILASWQLHWSREVWGPGLY